MLGPVEWRRTLGVALLLATVALATLGVATAAAAWLAPADMAPANAANQHIGLPSIAVARDGTAFAAFQHFDGTHSRIAVAMRTPGGGFGAVRDLSDPASDSSSPVLAVDRQGNATVAWYHGPDGVIQARFRPAGADWSAIQTLSAITTGLPALAAGDNGAAVVVWARGIGGGVAQVEAAVRPAGSGTFGGALPVSPNTGQTCGHLRVAMDAAGDVAALWTERTPDPNARYLVESNVKAAGAAAFAGSQVRSTEATGSSPCNTDIQITPEGRALAMWDFSDGTVPTYVEYADRTGSSFATGAWSGNVKVSSPTEEARSPLLAFDDSGNATATWLVGSFAMNQQVVSSSVRAGLGGFSPTKPLTGPNADNDKAVGASSNGDAMVAFVGMSNGNDAVFSARRQPGTDLGEVTPIVVAPPAGATVTFGGPDIALDDQGNAFAIWVRNVNDGTNTTESAQVAGYDPVAPAITAANVPATGTAGQPVSMSGAATDRMSGASLHFDFGDGTGADGANVAHAYVAAGTFTVKITATDGAGNKSSTTRSIVVAPAPAGSGPAGPGKTGGSTATRRVVAVSSFSWDRLSNGKTRLKSLIIERLVGPEKVRLSCKGKGCRKRANRTIKKHGKKLSLSKYVKGMTLAPKAVLTVTVSRPGYVSRIFRYTMVKFRDPKKSTRCLAPGKKKSTAC